MTRKHFVAFADAFRVDANLAIHTGDENFKHAVEYAVQTFCDTARATNPRFDAARFKAAVWGTK